ncbi:hypothetical protein [Amycolatopsis sp. 3B14]|uniref:hypothetical protein n=1 Tax=Amycolatopsis sp. 3B14 TaxID=3243600 RepID=UPI003D95C815
MAFVDEIEAIGGPRVQIVPEDEHGLLDVRSIAASTDPSTVIYCCGRSSVRRRRSCWPPRRRRPSASA